MADTKVDLFLDQLVNAPLKDDRALMEFPFFSLQKRPRTQPFIYDDGAVKIEITPGAKGIATIWDKDILIYLASLLNERIEQGKPVEHTIRFPAYDFLKATGRGTGKRAYELLLDALYRLRSTNIVTTIEAGGQVDRRGFGWIETWRVVEKTDGRGRKIMAAVEVTLNDWMFRSIVKDRNVLTINREYFTLTKGLERRLYELARKHVGHQPDWLISMARLAQKCGTADTLRKFKLRLNQIIEAESLPDYHLELIRDPASEEMQELARDGYKRQGSSERILVRFFPKNTASRSTADATSRNSKGDGRPIGYPPRGKRQKTKDSDSTRNR